MGQSTSGTSDLILLSELYPPAVGGSAVLFENAYTRVREYGVSVVADGTSSPGLDGVQNGVQVYRRNFLSRRWGVQSRRGWQEHFRTIRAVRSIPSRRNTLIHCGRALPEGLSMLLGRPLLKRRYLCWAHGEGITTARTSREFTFLIRRVFRNATMVLANSHNTCRLVEELGVERQRIVIAQPGVDAARFTLANDGNHIRRQFAGRGETLLLTVGRLQRRKGHDKVIEALSLLAAEKLKYHYLIVGDGEERSRLESLVAQFGLDQFVTFVGKVSEQELPLYYSACDVFVHPNREYEFDIEGFGIVFLESQASGTPVIGGRSGGVPETIIENETGLLVDGTSAVEIAGSLRKLITDVDLRNRFGEQGRLHVQKTFSWDQTARAVESAQQRAGEILHWK